MGHSAIRNDSLRYYDAICDFIKASQLDPSNTEYLSFQRETELKYLDVEGLRAKTLPTGSTPEAVTRQKKLIDGNSGFKRLAVVEEVDDEEIEESQESTNAKEHQFASEPESTRHEDEKASIESEARSQEPEKPSDDHAKDGDTAQEEDDDDEYEDIPIQVIKESEEVRPVNEQPKGYTEKPSKVPDSKKESDTSPMVPDTKVR